MRPLQAFLRLEAASGILLLVSAAVALAWANVDPDSYQTTFGHRPRGIINDGLMAVFFLLVGLEIKRELVAGELSTIPRARLPAIAALGGMILPAGIFTLFNWAQPGRAGWGIPMATDIAFSVGVLTLLKDRVPRSLFAFVTALAIFDDMGGILVIALFYGGGLYGAWLAAAAGVVTLLWGMNRRRISSVWAYVLVGTGLWLALHGAGIHATIAGVVVGLMIPAGPRAVSLTRIIDGLHPWVAFVIMPVFALANSGVVLRQLGASVALTPVALGVAVGLFGGKTLGVFGFTMLAIRLGLAPMPRQATVAKLIGASAIAGIGFTVALFIAALAFQDLPDALGQAKVGVLLGSLTAGIVGFVILGLTPPVARNSAP